MKCDTLILFVRLFSSRFYIPELFDLTGNSAVNFFLVLQKQMAFELDIQINSQFDCPLSYDGHESMLRRAIERLNSWTIVFTAESNRNKFSHPFVFLFVCTKNIKFNVNHCRFVHSSFHISAIIIIIFVFVFFIVLGVLLEGAFFLTLSTVVALSRQKRFFFCLFFILHIPTFFLSVLLCFDSECHFHIVERSSFSLLSSLIDLSVVCLLKRNERKTKRKLFQIEN